MSNILNEKDHQQEVEELTYSDMYASLLLNGEITFTILAEDVEKVKVGIKNCKARQAKKDKDEGLVPDTGILEFESKENKEIEGVVDLTITYSKRHAIRVFKTTIPEQF